jgi:hypothetical protein
VFWIQHNNRTCCAKLIMNFDRSGRQGMFLWIEMWFRRVSSSGIWSRVVRWVSTEVSEEHIASIFRVKKIGSAKPASKPVATQRTTRRHIPKDDTLHNHRCENLKSYKIWFYSLRCCFEHPKSRRPLDQQWNSNYAQPSFLSFFPNILFFNSVGILTSLQPYL